MSFDFGGSSAVTIHALTKNFDVAERLYTKLAADEEHSGKDRILLEMLEFPDEFIDVNGRTAFWGEHSEVKTVYTNNH